MENRDLQNKLEKLSDELDAYSFDIQHLSIDQKEEIKGLYKMLYKIYNNKIFIENIKDSNIRITDKIFINNKLFDDSTIDNKTTLYFENCKNVTAIISSKVCHITLQNCENFNLKTRGGSITGLDDINCKHVIHVLENSSVYFLDVSNSEGCVFYISENNALDTTISSYGSPDIKIITTCPKNGVVINKFVPNISFFDIYRLYQFERRNNLIQLYYNTTDYGKKFVKSQ